MDVLDTTERPAPALSAGAFDYPLPPELIAQTPAPTRDSARLLVLDRRRPSLEHAGMKELPRFLLPGDLLVLNDTRVRPARIFGRTVSGGAVELLLVDDLGAGMWQCLGRPGKRLRPDTQLMLAGGAAARVNARLGGGRYKIAFAQPCDVPALLARHGELPLPPYIRRADGPVDSDRERYQTIFAREEGAIAAPTAGLHFTEQLFATLRERGIGLAWLTLHVGPATFLPLRHDDVRRHSLEAERAAIPAATAEEVARAKREGRRVVAVGTTTVRALESAALLNPGFGAGEFAAGAFITPGFRFQVVDALLTNFHLPRSTLLLLVSALAGRERVLDAYAAAVQRRYRFYSYGDAMLIV